MKEMGHFCTQNKHFRTFLQICVLDSLEILLDGKY